MYEKNTHLSIFNAIVPKNELISSFVLGMHFDISPLFCKLWTYIKTLISFLDLFQIIIIVTVNQCHSSFFPFHCHLLAWSMMAYRIVCVQAFNRIRVSISDILMKMIYHWKGSLRSLYLSIIKIGLSTSTKINEVLIFISLKSWLTFAFSRDNE